MSRMTREHVFPVCLQAILGGVVILFLMVSVTSQAQTEPKPSEQLMAAAKNGNLEEVQRLIDTGAHMPGTLNSFRAIKFAKDGGHQEILELLEAGLNEYVEAGIPYDNLIEGLAEKTRARAKEDPGSVRWALEKQMAFSISAGYFRGLKEDPDGLLYPLGAAIDEEELSRRIDTAYEALQAEYETESDFEKKMRENNEAWEAIMRELEAESAEMEDEGQSFPQF